MTIGSQSPIRTRDGELMIVVTVFMVGESVPNRTASIRCTDSDNGAERTYDSQ